ncbi:MAG: phospho-N-acetylmuramoyl-pentapeptide-transferase [Candidatus Fischerbacteria bacterium RBG_13_37_8]|uniref:Phospho-N-acetylmuramoyl-pentapeptide-transferase n=1 Tax=Candidatus Fischerbacteria bacterium RBG_13_37_8 TaxID=1817863 RepID=A0A1F5VG30_9BACT|nr:MAG: phospho-N-acetylmuramoyl-pentapeptide-transferase [Candidatus Fischerbacteria bacterium RBG_13_37_8]
MLFYLFYSLHETFSYFRVFKYITFRTALAVLSAMLLSFFLGPWLIKRLKKFHLEQQVRDEGPKAHLKKAGTPTMGGLLILLSILLPTLLWADILNLYIIILLATCIIFGGIGFIDDYLKVKKKSSKGLSGKKRFMLEILICLIIGIILVGSGNFDTRMVFPFFKLVTVDLGWFYLIIIVLVLVGSANAVNITDGLDGLATGTVLIAGAAYTAFAYIAGHALFSEYLLVAKVPLAGEITVFCGALIGACIGFLWYNCYPAQLFMGDVGSLTLGSSLGVVAVMVKQELLLILVGGIFVIEALSVIVQVIYFKTTGGKRIFLMSPLHHHFELKGWNESKVVVRFWILAIIFALMSLATLKLR